jgi:hypothetical protein
MDTVKHDGERDDGETRYMPSIQGLLARLGCKPNPNPNDELRISYRFLSFLLSEWISHAPFDEKYYLEKNPDVAEALARRTISSAADHFRARGYFEGRLGAPVKVDRNFYLSSYPDVAKAYARRLLKDLQAHYDETGQHEGRFANAQQKVQLEAWTRELTANSEKPASDAEQSPATRPDF